MNEKKIDKIGLVGIVVGVLLGLPGLFEWLRVRPETALQALEYYGVPCLLIPAIVAITVRLTQLINESNKMQASFGRMHFISHKIRDSLHELIERKNNSDQVFDRKAEQHIERELLTEICNFTTQLFEKLTGDRTLVCIRLISIPDEPVSQASGNKSNQTCFLAGHCYNHKAANRNAMYEVVIDQHTRYREVNKKIQSANTVHYFNADINKDPDYHDPNRHLEPYSSTIVVPIQCLQKPAVLLGFLKLQTDKPNKLNGQWHVELLAMLADQIFSYLDCSRAIRQDQQDAQDSQQIIRRHGDLTR
jgi:GAF domain-containing protein